MSRDIRHGAVVNMEIWSVIALSFFFVMLGIWAIVFCVHCYRARCANYLSDRSAHTHVPWLRNAMQSAAVRLDKACIMPQTVALATDAPTPIVNVHDAVPEALGGDLLLDVNGPE